MELTFRKNLNDKKYNWKAKKGDKINIGVVLYVNQRQVKIHQKGLYDYSLFEELINLK